jgi:hypothetical protein
LAVWCGIALGAALQFRATAAIFPPLIVAYLVAKTWRTARKTVSLVMYFGLGLAPFVALLLVSNWWRYSGPFDFGRGVPLNFPILVGLRGFFFSPGKSLFLYAPIVVVAFVGLPKSLRLYRAEVSLILGLALVNIAFFARFPLWHGDHAWGPRYVQIVLPLLVVLVSPVADRWRRAVWVASMAGFLTAGILGTAIYFNQYFHFVDEKIGHKDDRYHVAIRNELAWNPLVGHARLLPAAVRNTLHRLDGHDTTLRVRPFPARRYDRFFWYWEPPQIDTWWAWLPAEGGQAGLLLLLPPLVGLAGWSVVKMRRTLSEPESVPVSAPN